MEINPSLVNGVLAFVACTVVISIIYIIRNVVRKPRKLYSSDDVNYYPPLIPKRMEIKTFQKLIDGKIIVVAGFNTQGDAVVYYYGDPWHFVLWESEHLGLVRGKKYEVSKNVRTGEIKLNDLELKLTSGAVSD